MSRLDSFIRRMCAQRDILNQLAADLEGVPGAVLEFGFGGGRTYDHLRELFPTRRVIVFDRVVSDAAGFRLSPAADVMVGDIRETSLGLPDGSAALIHADIGTGDAGVDRHLASWLPQTVARLLTSGGFAASSTALVDESLLPLPLPSGIPDSRYFLLRRL